MPPTGQRCCTTMSCQQRWEQMTWVRSYLLLACQVPCYFLSLAAQQRELIYLWWISMFFQKKREMEGLYFHSQELLLPKLAKWRSVRSALVSTKPPWTKRNRNQNSLYSLHQRRSGAEHLSETSMIRQECAEKNCLGILWKEGDADTAQSTWST